MRINMNNKQSAMKVLTLIACVISLFPIVSSIVSFSILPSIIPLHFDSIGNITRFGGSYEFIILGVVLTLISVIMVIVFAKVNMADIGRIIGFIGSIVMSLVFMSVVITFTCKVFYYI